MAGGANETFDAESLLRALMENVPGAIYRCMLDDIWKMVQVSDEIESISGYPASDFIEASVRTLVSVTHPDDVDPVDREIRAAIDAGRPFALEYRVVHADGGIRWVLERGVKTVDRDGREWLDGIIFDVTERQAAEQLRRERETEAARIEELEASRARVIEAADAARRRIERDLHDGAQQRLVAASIQLRAAERAVDGHPAGTLVGSARAELEAGMAELRELARGIHPALLTERGLTPAVRALAGRCAVPVAFADELEDRLPPVVESGLYFTIAEALTNVDRYAGATHATVRLSQDGDGVEVAIEDDGRGGADGRRGTGLRGLEDRLAALGGTLELDSPEGGGTRLRARVPLEA
jgi:PAS domain S-box-containing protein